jgi:hypothetical protein
MFPVRYSFSRAYCQRPETKARLQAVIQKVAGRAMSCEIVTDDSAADPVAAAKQPIPNRSASLETMRNNEFVQQVTSIFGGTLVDVRPVTTPGMHET